MTNRVLLISGTSGSGKTTVMRKIMAEASQTVVNHVEGRGRPVSYTLGFNLTAGPKVVVIGSYESVTGGCDNMPSPVACFQMVQQAYEQGYSVAFEGLLVGRNIMRNLALHRAIGDAYQVVHLSTPLEECYESIYKRREAAGKPRGPKPGNTLPDMRAHQSVANKLRAQGCKVHSVNRDDAFKVAMSVLRGEI